MATAPARSSHGVTVRPVRKYCKGEISRPRRRRITTQSTFASEPTMVIFGPKSVPRMVE